MPGLNHRQHLKSLDGLRGFAFLIVFFYHEYPGSSKDPLTVISHIGWTGVDLFFVLSGFLITGILYDTLQQPHYFRNFYARRGLRLFPVYLLVVVCVLIVSQLLGGRPTVWALPFLLYCSNIVRNLDKQTGISIAIDVSHFWSLAIEEQFYLVWPLILLWARTRRRILWLCGVGSLLAVALRWMATAHANVPIQTSFLELPTRLDNLLAGGALAILMRNPQSIQWLTRVRLNLGIVCGATLLGFAIFISKSFSPTTVPMIRYGYLGSSILFASLIALALQPDSWAHRLGSVSILRTFGRYSYGLYLLHFLPNPEIHGIYDLLKVKTGTEAHATNLSGHLLGVVFCFIYLGFILCVAMLSYHLLELPLLRMKKVFAYRDEQTAHRMQPDQDTIVAVTSSPATD